MKKRAPHAAGRCTRTRHMARISAAALLTVLVLAWTCTAAMMAGDFSRPASLRLLYAANACGIFQPCPT